jgi:hypothetical protein
MILQKESLGTSLEELFWQCCASETESVDESDKDKMKTE